MAPQHRQYVQNGGEMQLMQQGPNGQMSQHIQVQHMQHGQNGQMYHQGPPNGHMQHMQHMQQGPNGQMYHQGPNGHMQQSMQPHSGMQQMQQSMQPNGVPMQTVQTMQNMQQPQQYQNMQPQQPQTTTLTVAAAMPLEHALPQASAHPMPTQQPVQILHGVPTITLSEMPPGYNPRDMHGMPHPMMPPPHPMMRMPGGVNGFGAPPHRAGSGAAASTDASGHDDDMGDDDKEGGDGDSTNDPVKHRKVRHNLAERRRTNRINKLFNQLYELLSSAGGSSLAKQ